METTVFTPEQIATLNEARTILKTAADQCNDLSWATPSGYIGSSQPNAGSYAKVGALAFVAEEAVFTVMNWAAAHHVHELTDDELHNRERDGAAA